MDVLSSYGAGNRQTVGSGERQELLGRHTDERSPVGGEVAGSIGDTLVLRGVAGVGIHQGRIPRTVDNPAAGVEPVALGREAGLEVEQRVGILAAPAAAEVQDAIAALAGPFAHAVKQRFERRQGLRILFHAAEQVLHDAIELGDEHGAHRTVVDAGEVDGGMFAEGCRAAP